MKLIFDPTQNIGYIKFREKASDVDTIQIGEEINIDLAPDGTIYGIELLNANEQLAGLLPGKLVIEDASTGRVMEISLPV